MGNVRLMKNEVESGSTQGDQYQHSFLASP